MTQDEAIKIVLNLARSEIGYHEKISNSMLEDKTANSGSGNYTKFAAFLDSQQGFYNGAKNGYAWCDVFTDYLFAKSFGAEMGRQLLCQPMRSGGAGCIYSAQYYQQQGRLVHNPQPGDQIFFTYSGEISHTGIVEAVNGNTITTIEGNSNDQVSRCAYTASNPAIYGYGRPRWELLANMSQEEAYVVELPAEQSTSEQALSSGILFKGSTGDAVKQMQEKLIQLGYDLGSDGADGDFGYKTWKAVVQFQKDYGLDTDGEAGPLTLAKLESVVNPQKPQSTTAQTTTSASGNKPADEQKPSSQPAQQTTQQQTAVVKPAQTTLGEQTYSGFSVGDTVNFIGSKHYRFANAKSGFKCKPGKAKITLIYRPESSKHPFHVVRVIGGGSTVYGWVDEKDIEVINE